jgi:hypothetical protein
MAGSVRRFGPSDLLGVVLIAGAGYGVYSEYQKSAHATAQLNRLKNSIEGHAGLAKTPVIVKENAHEFLAKLAKTGDEVAAKTVEATSKTGDIKVAAPQLLQAPRVDVAEEFRFDVSREGLAGALQSILETKRSYEKNLINEARRTGRYSSDFAQQCRQLREEKDELKRMIDGLYGKNKASWWWPF